MAEYYKREIEDDGITLKELFKIILRYRMLIGLITCIALVIGGVNFSRMEPIYQASGEILVDTSNSSLLTDKISDQYSESASFASINDAVIRMRGTSIADSVIIKTCSFAIFSIPKEYFNKIQYFAAIPPQTTKIFSIIPSRKNTDADYLVLNETGSLMGKGKYNEKFVLPFFSIILSDLNPVKSFDIMLQPVRYVRARILNNLKVSNIRDSNIIRVSCSSQDPVMAKMLTNGFMDELSYQDLLDKREKATIQKTFLEDQFKSVTLVLEGTENNYLNIKKSTGIVSLDAQTTQYIGMLGALEERRIDFEIKLAEATASNEKAASILKGDAETLDNTKFITSPLTDNNSMLQELNSKIVNLQIENTKLKAQYNSSHPLVKQNEAELEATQNQLSEAISTIIINATKGIDPLLRPVVESRIQNIININVYKQLLARIKTEIANLNRTLDKLPQSEIDKARYERDIGINRTIHDLLVTRLEEARIMEASAVSDIRVINRAETPLQPIASQKAKILLLSMFAGLFVAGIIVFGVEYFKPSLNSTERIEKVLGASVLAMIPHDSKIERKILVDPMQKYGYEKFQPYELFNSLIINLLSSLGQEDNKTVVVSSAYAQEGKSLISANLALTLARAGKKVLLIDCDFRNPIQHNIFGIPNDCGFIDLIRDNSPKGFIKTAYTNLIFLPAGNVGDNVVSEIFHDANLVDAIRKLEKRFDMIIIDTPPIMLYMDAIVLLTHFKNVLLVMKSSTHGDAVIRTRKVLQKVGARLIGVVVNDVKRSILFGSSFDGYEYGHRYGYGYGYGDTANRKASN